MSKNDVYNADSRRRVLQSFMDSNRLRASPWAQAAGMSESVIRHFLEGRSESMSDRTYAKLASGAAQLLGAPVYASQLRGDPPPTASHVPIHHYVGAGDEIFVIDGNDAIDYVTAPPSFIEGGAAVVRGESMRPIFEPGDLLFWRHIERPPKALPRRAVIVMLRNSSLFVKKLLPGSRKGHFHLLSIDPHTSPMLDQPVEAIARIGWVKPGAD